MQTLVNNHFSLNNESSYQKWRDKKLSNYPMQLEDLVVEVNNPADLTAAEKQQLGAILDQTNMVLYATKQVNISDDFELNKERVRKLGEQFSMLQLDHNECADNDAITALQVNQQGLHKYYIPYSNKAINWHTDGYYNRLDEQIYSLILHCVCPAHQGGENKLLDPEMVYIQLRDKNPEHIRALMDPDALIIPKNVIDGELIRPDRSGPIFMFDQSEYLHMRYSARKRNAIWKDNDTIIAAEKALREIMKQGGDYQFEGKLQPGQGLLCRNVLHTRAQFDEPKQSNRLMFRGRYFDKLIS
ncbi:MAG: TauD/TfdA family dioxygenase [Pseudomonadota bacterium]